MQANPGWQGWQATVAEVVNSPAAHTVQLIAPLEEKLPAMHENRWFPGDGQKLPAGHKTHVDAAGEEYSPVGQGI